MNSSNAKFKMSKIEKLTNKQIIIVFFVQIVLCFIAAVVGTLWQLDIKVGHKYLALNDSESKW